MTDIWSLAFGARYRTHIDQGANNSTSAIGLERKNKSARVIKAAPDLASIETLLAAR